jgi:hypothetical protein
MSSLLLLFLQVLKITLKPLPIIYFSSRVMSQYSLEKTFFVLKNYLFSGRNFELFNYT